MKLEEKLLAKQARVGIIGMGYVGLPLAVAFAQEGYEVTGVDLSSEKVGMLNEGRSYISDVEDRDICNVLLSGRFVATTDFSAIQQFDALCICVPTPLSKQQEPNLTYIESVVAQLSVYLQKDTLVVLESTTYPGTTDERIADVLAEEGLLAGSDYYLCYSPERVDPGNQTYSIRNTPKVVGGTTPTCLKLGEILYSSICERVVPVSTTKAAEMSKLLENTFRSVNIAFINEVALMCDTLGINVWEVIQAASTKPFGFMPFYPGPGIGGHCIPLDPMYLSWKAKGENFFSRFIELSQDLNRNMPRYIIQKVVEVLNVQRKSINGSRILLLGMAYKPNVNDLRESPSLEIYELLKEKGAVLTVNDPVCDSMSDKQGNKVEIERTVNEAELSKYDCIVFLTSHSVYNVHAIADSGAAILDTRNAFAGLKAPNVLRIGDELTLEQDRLLVAL
ncbi:nucleotide sugar dehydrogenase [Paenibacillus sp. SC116]|uniref:nucleotide sugar dehydrogenase n=1 Tax=Paenibacillus sp. SC116 TaxID=2968986 RepID=UPI00215ABF05|nr:nucleotide sugar dehydrogenase [Paenibacillus sp. SC116]MCR8845904.1 nucleotide sugar dehydrogenase [Paenibacillus sp. SC116]